MKEILTNEIKFNLNLDVFKNNYKVDCFRKQDGHIYRKDILKEKNYTNIQSIFISSDKVYILTLLKDEIEYQEMLNDGYVRVEEFPREDVIFSLLLNSLFKLNDADNLSNILGSLYYFIRRNGRNLIFLNINFYHNRLNLNVNTFTNKLVKQGQPMFVLKGNKLYYPTKEEKGEYIKANPNSRSNVAFISTTDDYKKCKSVIANEIITRMNKRFKEFLSIEFVTRFFESVKWQKDKYIKSGIENKVNDLKIIIINSTNNFKASEHLRKLLLWNCKINIFEPCIEISNELKSDSLNINIVLPKEEYSNGDKYLLSDSISVQNIYLKTLEKEYEKSLSKEIYYSSVIEKIIMELLLKLDIIEKKANLLKIYNIDVPHWEFHIAGYIANDKQKYRGYVSVKDGELDLQHFVDDENQSTVYSIKVGEKIMYCNLDNSNYYPLPNAQNLISLMQDNEKSATIAFELEEIKDIVKAVINKKDNILSLLDSFYRDTIYASELRELLKKQNNKSNFSKISKEYKRRHNIHIYNSPLTNENKEIIFNPCSDINYYVTKNDKGKDVVYYFVGKMEEVSKQDFSKGTSKWMPIKNINNCSKDEFDNYLNLIKNDILSINKYSTKPVLFKYLIEYIEMKVKLNAINK